MNNIPEIRFPEFRNDGEWREKKLADFNELMHGDGNWILSKDITLNGEHKIVQLSSIGFGTFKEKNLKTISNKTFLELKGTPIQKGDLLINRMVDSNKINSCIFPHDGNYVTSVDVCWIRQNHFLSNFFLMSLLCTNNSQIDLLSLSSGSGRVRISKKNLFEKFIFPLPQNPQEQKKIAECLSSLDDVIIGYEKKLKAIQNHKKGLMQNLFPQEGKTVPNYRFPEFENDEDWEERILGDISEIVRGGSPRPIQDYLTNSVDGLNWLKIADVPSDSKYITKTKERVINEALNSTREVNPGDLILSNSMSFGRPYILKIKTCIHDGWIAIRKVSTKSFEDYLYYFISSERSQNYFNMYAAGAAVKNLNAEIIKLLPVNLPKDKKEQKKIADCLSSVDELITDQANRIAQLKLHKKGLMQGLFPRIKD